jgi:hypothetical protein
MGLRPPRGPPREKGPSGPHFRTAYRATPYPSGPKWALLPTRAGRGPGGHRQCAHWLSRPPSRAGVRSAPPAPAIVCAPARVAPAVAGRCAAPLRFVADPSACGPRAAARPLRAASAAPRAPAPRRLRGRPSVFRGAPLRSATPSPLSLRCFPVRRRPLSSGSVAGSSFLGGPLRRFASPALLGGSPGAPPPRVRSALSLRPGGRGPASAAPRRASGRVRAPRGCVWVLLWVVPSRSWRSPPPPPARRPPLGASREREARSEGFAPALGRASRAPLAGPLWPGFAPRCAVFGVVDSPKIVNRYTLRGARALTFPRFRGRVSLRGSFHSFGGRSFRVSVDGMKAAWSLTRRLLSCSGLPFLPAFPSAPPPNRYLISVRQSG